MTTEEQLSDLRRRIDAVDDDIVDALKRRFALAREMRAFKEAHGLPRVDAARERAIFARVTKDVEPAERDTVFGVYERLFGGSRGVVETIARGVCVMGGKVLLCRAKGGSTTYLPGGHIEFGETAAQALVREMKEETGLDATIGGFLGVVENAFLQHGKKHCEINLVYRMTLADAPDGTPPAVSAREDWIDFTWCSLADLAAANLLPESIRAFCGKDH